MMYTKLICLALLGSVMFAAAGKMATDPELLQESCGDDEHLFKKPAQCPCKDFSALSTDANSDLDAQLGYATASLVTDVVAAINGAIEGDDFAATNRGDITILNGDCSAKEGGFRQAILDSVRAAQNAYYHLDDSQIQLSDNIGRCGLPTVRVSYVAVPEKKTPYYYNSELVYPADDFSTVCVDEFLGCNEHHHGKARHYKHSKYYEECGPVAKATVQVCFPLCCECCEDITAAFSGRNQPYSSSKNAEADLCFKATIFAGVQQVDKEDGDSVLIAECEPEMNLQSCRSPNSKQCARLSCDARSKSQSSRRHFY